MSADVVSMTNNFADGVWHFATVVYDGSARQLRFFVDGIASSNATVTANSGSANKLITNGLGIMAVSRTTAGPLRPFNGRVSMPQVNAMPAYIGDHLSKASEFVP